MRTIGILVSVLTVYSGIILLAAWSVTAFNRYEAGAERSASTTQAVVAATTLSRSRPSTRWRRPAPVDAALHHDDGGEDGDVAQTDVSTVRHARARPHDHGIMNCFVGSAAMKDTKL